MTSLEVILQLTERGEEPENEQLRLHLRRKEKLEGCEEFLSVIFVTYLTSVVSFTALIWLSSFGYVPEAWISISVIIVLIFTVIAVSWKITVAKRLQEANDNLQKYVNGMNIEMAEEQVVSQESMQPSSFGEEMLSSHQRNREVSEEKLVSREPIKFVSFAQRPSLHQQNTETAEEQLISRESLQVNTFAQKASSSLQKQKRNSC